MKPVMLINSQDYGLFLCGKKKATSRYGSRPEFEVGKEFTFKDNEYGHESDIVITKVYETTLDNITEEEAKDIGDYTRQDAIDDFTSVYGKLGRNVDNNTTVTIVYFKQKGLA